MPMDKMFVNVDRYGNTSAASVGIALAEAVDSGRVKVGDRIVFVAFGAGFTSGAVALEWTADPAHGRRAASVVPVASVRAPLDWDSVDPMPPRLMAALEGGPAGAPRRRRPRRARARPQGGPRMIDLTGRSAVVTGGSRGIGRAICLRLARQGADVCFSYRGNAAAAEATVADIEALGRRALAVQGDVTDPEAADALVKAALEAFGKVDILVNNAGITRDDLIMRMSVDDLAGGPRDQPLRRVLRHQGRHPADAQGPQRSHHQHHQRLGPGRPDGPGQLLLGQGRAHRPDQGHRARAGQPRHHRATRSRRASCSPS